MNTLVPNRLVHRAIKKGALPELAGYTQIITEAKIGEGSRVDLLLSGSKGRCYVEIKSVTMAEDGVAYFPDAVTQRGRKHLEELLRVKEEGHRAVLIFVVQRGDVRLFKPADFIDPEFAETLRRVHEAGVEILVFRAEVSEEEINLGERLPYDLSPSALPPSLSSAEPEDSRD